MRRTYLTLAILAILFSQLQAACPVGDLTLSTQMEIDDFTTTYSDCTAITGTLTIQGTTATEILDVDGLFPLLSISDDLIIIDNSDLIDISGLSNLVVVGGNIHLENLNDLSSLSPLSNLTVANGNLTVKEVGSITSLIGLDNLAHINGKLTLFGLNNITSLSDLANLTTIADGISLIFMTNLPNLIGLEGITSLSDIEVVSNPILENLTGLDNLTSLTGSLKIQSNNNMTSLTGLEGISSTGFYLQVLSNLSLTSLDGLDNLVTVNGQFWIGSNPILDDLTALSSLETINNQFNFVNNSSVIDFSGLESLLTVNGQLEIMGNGMLQSLDGLQNIITIAGDLNVHGNTELTDCAILSVCEKLDLNPMDVAFSANGPNCSSNIQVEDVCLSLPVELSAFTVRTQLGKSELRWTTESEVDNRGFEIEHSTDGQNFKLIGFQPGVGFSDRITQYRFEHDNPIKGTNYYRLKQIDFNHDFAYSHTLSVYNHYDALIAFPNPTELEINLSGYVPEQYAVHIANIRGELIEKIEDHHGKVISLAGYEPGVYLIHVFTTNRPKVFKVIKE